MGIYLLRDNDEHYIYELGMFLFWAYFPLLVFSITMGKMMEDFRATCRNGIYSWYVLYILS